MAGILANSATETMVGADTSPDNAVPGYLKGEQITLSVTGSSASFSWGISKPSGSTARSDLNSYSLASVRFTPDVTGYYVVTCNAGGTDYVLRVYVIDVVTQSSVDGVRLSPIAANSIPTPALGGVLFWDSTTDALSIKNSSGATNTVDIS